MSQFRKFTATVVGCVALFAGCSDKSTVTTQATGTGSNTSVADRAALDAQSAVRVNEVESSGGVPGDWVEFHNRSADTIDLSGFVFRDNDDSRGFILPAGTIIPANGFLVLDEAQFGFGIGAGDAARLFAPGGTTLIDSYTWTAHAVTTYGRCPDGTGAFTTTSAVTKGAANDCRPQIVINEIESSGGTPGDWVELFNAGTNAVDVSGFVFRDNNDASSYVIPAGTTVSAGGYLLIDEAQFGFGLGASDAARLFSPGGTTLVDSYVWITHATTSYGRCPNGTGAFTTTSDVTKGATNGCGTLPTTIRINEVESNLGSPGDWVELINTGSTPVDLTGFVFRDNSDLANYVLPAGSIVPANGYLVLEEAQFGFGLGGGDAARLFAPGGVIVIDSYVWTAHALTTYGRCPNGTGAFIETAEATKGAANNCGPGTVFDVWPGSATVENAEPGNLFAGNMSGLFYAGSRAVRTEGPGVLWAVRNGPGTLFRLTAVNNAWSPDNANGWSTGKALRYPNGSGDVDAEGVTVVAGAAYVAAERNNSSNSISRNSILRYELASEGTELIATREWDLTADLPPNGANLGLEAIAYIPDAWLVARGFVDDRTGLAYAPSGYPNHGDGLFFVGVEATGNIYAYALDQSSGSAVRIATFNPGFPQVMDISFDSEAGQLWAVCDNGCNGRSTVLRIDTAVGSATRGRFVIARRVERPTGMPNLNNEGFTFAPMSECVGGVRSAYWADDGNTGGFSLRRGTLTCSPF
jgi:Lamin Tail Domain